MGVLNIFLKNIPPERHIHSLEVNEDLSDLKKQGFNKPMRSITLEEYFKIRRENEKRRENYVPGQGFPSEVHVFSARLWRGYFEQARTTTLEEASLTTEGQHVRGRYDLLPADKSEKLENALLKALEEGQMEGQAMSYRGRMFPRHKLEVPVGLIQMGMWPCITFEMQSLQSRLLRSLMDVELQYDSEINIIYSKEPFGANCPVVIEYKEDGMHIKIDRRKKAPQVISFRSASLREPLDGDQHQFDDLIPPKPNDDPTYFATTVIAGKSRRFW